MDQRMNRIQFSIIVVAYNNENFIEQCLSSCLFEDYTDYEVIVVCNRSEDRTLDLIGRAQAAWPHIFRVIENSSNLGLGKARNIGLDAAKGEYVLFLDGDDWVDARLCRRLGEVVSGRNIDVCLFSHIRVYENFNRKSNRYQNLLWEGYRDTTRKRAQIMPNLGVAWNKAYRRSFLIQHELRFAPGYYEDVFLNFYVILFAEHFYTIPDALIYYRQRSGSITCTADCRHFTIFGEYYRIITLLSKNPGLTSLYGEAIYHYARSQILNVLHDGRRIPKGMEQGYVKQAKGLLQEFRRLLGLPEGRNLLVREKLLAWRNYRCYMAGHKVLKKIAKYTRKLRKLFKEPLEACLSPAWWGQVWALPLYRHVLVRFVPIEEKKILFESCCGESMGGSPYALSLALGTAGYECVWSLKNPSQTAGGLRFTLVRTGSWEYWKIAAAAKYFVSDANFPDALVKRQGQIHLQTLSGSPLQLVGGDLLSLQPWDKQWKHYAANCKRWDFLLSASKYATRIWRRAAPYPYHVLESGYPANDVFFSADRQARGRALREKLSIRPSAKVALYCPAPVSGKQNVNPFAKDIFDPLRIIKALGDDYILLLHATTPGLVPDLDMLPSGVLFSDRTTSFSDLALSADLLITDYSSVLFDFACLNHPILIYCPDYDEFAASHGFYFDIRAQSPGFVAHNQEELLGRLEEKAFLQPDSLAKVQAFHAAFCEFEDGMATRRVLAEVFGLQSAKTSDDNSRVNN